MDLLSDRKAATDAPVLDVIAHRWSTRMFDADAPVDEHALASALEAARWAPSASNLQPWRVIVARRGTPEHDAIVATLSGFNQAWAPAASALVVFITEDVDADGKPQSMALYDAGQAAAFFSIQAHASGLHVHQMSGFRRSDVASAFALEERFMPRTVIAVGTLGDPATADPVVLERENAPRTRRSLGESTLRNA